MGFIGRPSYDRVGTPYGAGGLLNLFSANAVLFQQAPAGHGLYGCRVPNQCLPHKQSFGTKWGVEETRKRFERKVALSPMDKMFIVNIR